MRESFLFSKLILNHNTPRIADQCLKREKFTSQRARLSGKQTNTIINECKLQHSFLLSLDPLAHDLCLLLPVLVPLPAPVGANPPWPTSLSWLPRSVSWVCARACDCLLFLSLGLSWFCQMSEPNRSGAPTCLALLLSLLPSSSSRCWQVSCLCCSSPPTTSGGEGICSHQSQNLYHH